LRRRSICASSATFGWSHEETNKGVRIRTVIDYVRDQFRQDEREWFSIPASRANLVAA
jgi:hypothetical protein